MKILLIGAPLSRNLGGPSLLETTRAALDRVLGEADYTFISPLAEDLPLAGPYGMSILEAVSIKKLVLAAIARRLLGITVGVPAVRNVLSAYRQCDLVVDIWGIAFSDTIGRGTFRSSVLSGGRFLVGMLLGKPVVKYTADLGPFETRWNRFFAKWYFNHTLDLILARSETTRQRLLQLGVRTRVEVCPDTAFLLPAERSSRSAEVAEGKGLGRPTVGFSVSHMAARQSEGPERYIEQIARLADHVADTTGARVVFIPNEISSDLSADDAHFCQRVWDAMARHQKAAILPVAELNARELKGVIGECDVVVAARYHTIVSALSQAIPVLAIGWHAKYGAVMRLAQQEESVCEVSSMSLEELKAKFDRLWLRREEVRAQIRGSLPQIEQQIWRGADAVASVLKRKTSGRHSIVPRMHPSAD